MFLKRQFFVAKFFKKISNLPQASAGYVPRTPDDLNGARGYCVKKYEVTGERVTEYRARVFRESDRETPFYIQCVFERLDLFRDGEFVTDDYIVQLGRGEGARGAVEACYDRSEEPQIRAFRTFMCFIEKGLLPEGY